MCAWARGWFLSREAGNEKRIRDVLLRVVHQTDFVTLVPPWWLGYAHVGKVLYIDEHRNCYYGDDIDKLRQHAAWTNEEKNPPLSDHEDRDFKPTLPGRPSTPEERVTELLKKARPFIEAIKPVVALPFALWDATKLLLAVLVPTSRFVIASSQMHAKTHYTNTFSDERPSRELTIPEDAHFIWKALHYCLIWIGILVAAYLVLWRLPLFLWPLGFKVVAGYYVLSAVFIPITVLILFGKHVQFDKDNRFW